MKHILSLLALSILFLFTYSQRPTIKPNTCTILFDNRNIKSFLSKAAFIELYKFDLEGEGGYTLVDRVSISKKKLETKITKPRHYRGYFQLVVEDSIVAKSNPVTISSEVITIRPNSIEGVIDVSSKQNDFMKDHLLLFLAVPYSIQSDNNYSVKLFRTSYQLNIPRKYMMLKYRIEEYEKNVINEIKRYDYSFFAADELFDKRVTISLYTLEKCYYILKKKLAGDITLKRLKDYIENEKKIEVGRMARSIRVFDQSAKQLTIDSGYFRKHNFTLIDIWASWCVPCRKNAKKMKEIYKTADTSNFKIIGISIDSDTSAWLKAIKDDEIVWDNFIDTLGWKGNVSGAYNLSYIPRNFLFDRSGKIVAIDVSDNELQQFLEREKLIVGKTKE